MSVKHAWALLTVRDALSADRSYVYGFVEVL